MSLRTRLVLLTVALVVIVSAALSALHLNSLVDAWSTDALDRAELVAQQVKAFLVDHIEQHMDDHPPAATLEETKRLWAKIVAEDQEIASMLEQTMASTRVILEIQVIGEDGEILASSNPSRIGTRPAALPNLGEWRSQDLSRRLYELLARRPDYQVTVPLGIPQQPQPIFTIQVVVSSVLLRSSVVPQIRALGLISGGLLALAVVLSVAATNLALRPLKRIDQTIDRIVAGNFTAAEKRSGPSEFAVVEHKLNLLGEQFQGTQQVAADLRNNVDQLLERLASQLDVASRLAAIGRLTGGVAHEIKNPLNAIALRLELLRAKLENPDLYGELDVLAREVKRLDRVVKTFLDFTRPVDVQMKEVDLTSLTREMADLVTPQAKLQKVEVEFSAHEPAPMRGDPDILKQAVLNLVTNAMEAMKNGGRLMLGVERSGGLVTLSVQDTGQGIPAELRDKVFQLYFTTKDRGSGIGLAMTYRAVQLHNGTIEYASEPGKGTTFRIQFSTVAMNV